tara:strand:+ start:129 stop:752 length:624 start_codon:yes stop_codon:yes gene_type:complete
MGLLSKEAKAAFADRQANTGKTGSRFLNTKDLSEEGTRITFLGDQNHMVHGFGVWCERKGGGKRINLRTATKLSKSELEERANEVGAVAPKDLQREFYAFTVWNYAEEAVQIFEFNQSGLINPIIEHLSDEEIEGNEEEYDMKVTRTKTGSNDIDVRYSATPLASGRRKQDKIKKQIQKAFDELLDENYDISELFNPEGDPFKPELA